MQKCAGCKEFKTGMVETNDGDLLCRGCAAKAGFCEICGSVRTMGQTADTQLHYNPLCFK